MRVYSENQGIATANIPTEMKGYPSWVVWCYEQKPGKEKPYKVPYCATQPERRASHSDVRTWAAFSEAVEAYEAGQFDGIGLVLSSGDPFTAIDLDRCRDAETGDLDEWAARVVRQLGGYAEISPSGTGVHVIVRGRLPDGVRHKIERDDGRKIEAYSDRRFITVTGRLL